MRFSNRVKPISYLKANAADVLDTLADSREPLIITQNGEARAVMQDLATYESTQETLALLKILALGTGQAADGQVVEATSAFAQVRAGLQSAEDAKQRRQASEATAPARRRRA